MDFNALRDAALDDERDGLSAAAGGKSLDADNSAVWDFPQLLPRITTA